MAKEGAPRSQENPRKISPEQIAWDPAISERNREVVEVLRYLGEVTSRRGVMPGDKVEAPTKFAINGVEVFVSSHGNGFFQAHVDGVEAEPSVYPQEAQAEEIIGEIGRKVVFLQNHPKR